MKFGGRAGIRRFFERVVAMVISDPHKLLTVAAVAALAALGGGCAAVAPLSAMAGSVLPSSTLGIYNATELRLQQKNFVIVRPNVLGQSKGFSLFGLFTIVPAKFTTAMSQLNARADMQPGSSRTLANLIMEKDSAYFVLFSIPRTSIRADVIEFTPDIQAQPPPGDTKANAD